MPDSDRIGQLSAEPIRPSVSLRVMVVDDSDDASATLALLLQMSGYTTCTAADGVKALEMASAFRPDAVVLDIGLPGLSGLEVAARLRNRPGGSNLLLIALSGLSQQRDQLASRQAGFDEHLVKPVGLEHLLNLLERHQTLASDTR